MTLEKSDICNFGWKPENFHLLGIDGQIYSLDYFKDAKAGLILFICNHCPYVHAIMPRLIEDCEKLTEQGVKIMAIMSNDTTSFPEDSFEKMREFSALHHFPFPYVIDTQQTVAKAFDAVCTPEIYGFNADLELQYRGRVDDGTMENPEPTKRELYDAMQQIIETGKGPADQTHSMGCSIKWYD